MHILIAWKSVRLSEVEATQRWQRTLNRWKEKYQTLSEHPLHILETQAGSLFLGLLYVPGLFRQWQECYEDDTYTIAWSGIAHNLSDRVSQQHGEALNAAFATQFQHKGHALLRELDGRFTVSILHHSDKTLRIAVSNSGLVPAFTTTGPYGITVGTRIAPLLDLVGRKVVANRNAMLQLFAMDWCLGNRTPFEGVVQIEQGTELVLEDQSSELNEYRYFPPGMLLDHAETLKHQDYLEYGTETVNLAISQQMRHTTTPLVDITAGMDSRTIVASLSAQGFQLDGAVSGEPNTNEILTASNIAEQVGFHLHPIYPGAHYAENFTETLKQWVLWTEGMIPAHINFARSVVALSPTLRQFYSQYQQVFSGVGADYRNSYGPEILVFSLPRQEVISKLFKHFADYFSEHFLPSHDALAIRSAIEQSLSEAIRLGLSKHQLIDYFYWRERASRWGGFMVDMQQVGRHVFTPLCHRHLTAIFFAMSLEENLSAVWHYYHVHRMKPALAHIPYGAPPLLPGLRQTMIAIHPLLYKIAWHTKQYILSKQRKPIPKRDKQKLGTYFHPYLENLLFSGKEWWPNVIAYEQGRTIWENFRAGREAKPLWNLVTFEIWAKTFLE